VLFFRFVSFDYLGLVDHLDDWMLYVCLVICFRMEAQPIWRDFFSLST